MKKETKMMMTAFLIVSSVAFADGNGMSDEEFQEFQSHRQHIEGLSKIVDDHRGVIESNEASTKSNSETLAKHDKTIKDHRDHIIAVEDIVSGHRKDIETNEANINSNKSNISTMGKVVAENDASIEEHSNHITELEKTTKAHQQAIETTENKVVAIDKTVQKHDVIINEAIARDRERMDNHDYQLAVATDVTNKNATDIKTTNDAVKKIDAKHDQKLEDAKKVMLNKDIEHDQRLNSHTTVINSQDSRISNNTQAINNLNNRIDHMDNKFNKGMSLMAAMTAIDFQDVNVGELGIGAGVGHYTNEQGIAIGVAYAPTQSFRVNAKYSVNTSDVHNSAVALGGTYKFKVR